MSLYIQLCEDHGVGSDGRALKINSETCPYCIIDRLTEENNQLKAEIEESNKFGRETYSEARKFLSRAEKAEIECAKWRKSFVHISSGDIQEIADRAEKAEAERDRLREAFGVLIKNMEGCKEYHEAFGMHGFQQPLKAAKEALNNKT